MRIACPGTLTADECRVLGTLIEKGLCTPAYYPLSLHSVCQGSNQKSCRRPIVAFDLTSCEKALDKLVLHGIAERVQGPRVQQWKHKLVLPDDQLAIIAELLLRGPQSQGELRANLQRFPCRPADLERETSALVAEGWVLQTGRRLSHTLLQAANTVPTRPANPGSPSLVTPAFYSELDSAVICGFHVMLMGPRGTGKTTAIKSLAARSGKRLHVIQVHADFTTEELRGEPGLADGNSTFQHSPVVDAAEQGDWVLLDEANLGRAGVTAWMNNVLDEDGIISIPATGEQIPVAKGFRAFFCFNAGYQGTRELNQALLDRCRVIYCDYWLPDQEIAYLKRHVSNLNAADMQRIVKVAAAIREGRRKGVIDFDCSIRTLHQWAADADHRTQDLLESFKAVVLAKVGDPQEYGPQHAALLEVAKLAIQ